MYSLEELKSFLKKRLSKKRFIHSLNVADEAYKLAGMYGEDPDKAYLAGLLHDVCKESPTAEQDYQQKLCGMVRQELILLNLN